MVYSLYRVLAYHMLFTNYNMKMQKRFLKAFHICFKVFYLCLGIKCLLGKKCVTLNIIWKQRNDMSR